MSDTEAFTVRVPTEVKAKFEALAQSTNRTRSWLAAQAIALYVEQESWQIREIEEAIVLADGAQAGWVDGEDVEAWLKTWGTADEKPAPCAQLFLPLRFRILQTSVPISARTTARRQSGLRLSFAS